MLVNFCAVARGGTDHDARGVGSTRQPGPVVTVSDSNLDALLEHYRAEIDYFFGSYLDLEESGLIGRRADGACSKKDVKVTVAVAVVPSEILLTVVVRSLAGSVGQR